MSEETDESRQSESRRRGRRRQSDRNSRPTAGGNRARNRSDDRQTGERDISGADLPPREIDRMFDLLEEAIEADTLTSTQFDRLLSILRDAVGSTAGSDPESLAELLSLLEQFLLDPDEFDELDIDGMLGLFEEALAGVSAGDGDALGEVFDVLAESLQDPTAVDPEDVDRFQSSIQQAFFDVADPARGFGALFGTGRSDGKSEDIDRFRIAQLAAAMTQQASGNSVETGVRTGTRLAYAAANAESPAELLTATRAITLDELQRAGIDIGEDQSDWLQSHEDEAIDTKPMTREALEERGARLITQSAEVGRDESVHPAFGDILGQLSTDEARILRLLATEGPQGVIDIYDRQYLPPKKWRVARNLTMLGRDAGCRIQRRAPVYVQNLRRLGIAEVSEEPIENLKRYEIIEAQSHVEQARTRAKRPRSDYKRFQLTDMGVEFCELCFPFEVNVDGEGLLLREIAGADR